MSVCRYSRLPSTVAALVVDSAPVTAGPGAVENVIAASAPPGWRRWVMTRYIKGSMRLRGPDGGMAAYWESLRRMGWGRPQLFMYSRDDPIANAAKVRQLVTVDAVLRTCASAVTRTWCTLGHATQGSNCNAALAYGHCPAPLASSRVFPAAHRSISWWLRSERWGRTCGRAAGSR